MDFGRQPLTSRLAWLILRVLVHLLDEPNYRGSLGAQR